METRNVTKSAKMLSVSQPAASKMLNQLEERVGFQLFTKVRGRLKPTQDGLNFYRHAKHTVTSFEQLEGFAKRIKRGEGERLNISALPAMCNGALINAISHYKESHPTVNVQLKMEPSPDVISSVLKGKSDVGIAMRVEGASQLSICDMVKSKVAIVPNEHPLSAFDEISCNDLAEYDFIYIGVRTGDEIYQDSLFDNFDVVPKATYITTTYSVGCHFVAQGLACAIVDPYTAESNSNLGYKIVQLKEFLPFNFSILSSSLSSNHENATDFIDNLIELLK
ncbi:LysR family transcriptional regulator [Photobacterium satsumensis]